MGGRNGYLNRNIVEFRVVKIVLTIMEIHHLNRNIVEFRGCRAGGEITLSENLNRNIVEFRDGSDSDSLP